MFIVASTAVAAAISIAAAFAFRAVAQTLNATTANPLKDRPGQTQG